MSDGRARIIQVGADFQSAQSSLSSNKLFRR